MIKRGQAAMEFLMAYGWAILAAIIVIGVLAIYFRPGQLTSDSVVVTAPFYGVGVALSPGVIWVEVKNNGGVPVTITGASLDSGCNEATGIGNILSGSTRTLIFDGCLFSYGDLINKDILINYTKVGSSLTLQSKGTISGRVLVNAMSGGDTTPPVLSAGSPSGILAAGTTQINISLTTNETATCRYSMISGVSYGWMINTFSTTGATTHSQLVTGLVNGGNYNYYVRCNDTSGNFNTNDSTISFSVASIINHNYVIKSCYNGSNANNICSTETDCPSGICLEPIVAWWSLDEASGTRAATGGSCGSDCDLGNQGSVERNTTIYKEGSASATFETETFDKLSCTASTCDELFISGSITYGCWSWKDIDNTNGYFLRATKSFGGQTDGYLLSHLRWIYKSGCMIGNGTAYVSAYSANNAFPVNTWIHTICRFDDNADTIQPFINGELSGISNTTNTMDNIGNNLNFTLSDVGTSTSNINGSMDECFVANQAYTNSQICEICRFGLDGEESDRGSLCGSCSY